MAHHPVSHDQAHDPVNITNPEHGEHQIVTPFQYGMVYIALLIGTAITVGAAYIPMGAFNPVVALAIACTKAVIVILFFMHVKFQSRLIKMTVGLGFLTFLILVMMTLLDYVSRAWGQW